MLTTTPTVTQSNSGSLKVVGHNFDPDLRGGVVTITADTSDFAKAFDELRGQTAKTMALAHAATSGMADPRLNGLGQMPYPVDANGKAIESAKPDPENPVARYCIDVKVCGPIG